MREIMLDTETTGLSPKDGDRIVEIGCVEMINRFPTGEVWHKYINPQRSMPKPAYDVHGLSEDFLSDKPLFGDLAEDFLDFIKGAKLVIHNAPFDIGFLNFELERVDLQIISYTSVIDTLQLARQKHPGASNNLDALCRRYNIDNSSREKHGALLDSELLAEVYLELIGGHQAGFDLGSGGGSNADQGGALNAKVKPRATALPSLLTKDEAQAHDAFIKTLGDNPMWNKYSS